MPDVYTIHVFIASPGDLAVERRAFKDVIDGLNSGFGDGAGVKFVPLGWEDTLATTGRWKAASRRPGNSSPRPTIAKDRRDFNTARELWSKARELYSKIGIPNEVQRMQSLLDSLPQGK